MSKSSTLNLCFSESISSICEYENDLEILVSDMTLFSRKKNLSFLIPLYEKINLFQKLDNRFHVPFKVQVGSHDKILFIKTMFCVALFLGRLEQTPSQPR